jgi:hypothetical protein
VRGVLAQQRAHVAHAGAQLSEEPPVVQLGDRAAPVLQRLEFDRQRRLAVLLDLQPRPGLCVKDETREPPSP